MKLFSSSFVVLLAAIGTTSAALIATNLPICVDDNACYLEVLGNGVVGTLEGSHQTDCQSYASCTSTQPGPTVTTTQTVTPAVAVVAATVTPSDNSVTSTVTPSQAVATASTTLPAETRTATVTPPLATVTVTQAASYKKRDNNPATQYSSNSDVTCPSAVPSYASDCKAPGAYADVCSCFGIPRSTQTVTGPATTVTTTTTLTQQTTTAFTTVGQRTSTVYVTLPQSTTTTTVTVTLQPATATTTLSTQYTTVTTSPPFPTLCNNAGAQWAYYYDDTPVNNEKTNQDYDPARLKGIQPGSYGTTTYLGVDLTGDTKPIYNGPSKSTVNLALNHRGYIYAPETGTYNFTARQVDDVISAWIGSLAYSNWGRPNRDQYVDFFVESRGGFNLPYKLTAGTYTAFRLVFKQGQGPAKFTYTITSPSGKVLVSSDPNAPASPYLVQYSCDGTTAPSFKPFGQEP